MSSGETAKLGSSSNSTKKTEAENSKEQSFKLNPNATAFVPMPKQQPINVVSGFLIRKQNRFAEDSMMIKRKVHQKVYLMKIETCFSYSYLTTY